MSSSETEKQTGKKRLPLWALLPLDALLIAGNLLTFAYFHHVNPVRKAQPDYTAEYTSYVPPARSTTGSSISGTTQTTAAVSQTDSASAVTNTDTTVSGTTLAVTTDGNAETTTASAGVSGTSQNESSASTSKTTASTSTTAVQLQPDLSGWGEKWPDKFSYDNTVIAEDMFYKSHDLNITVTKQQVGDSVAFVADVYMRWYDNLMSDVTHQTNKGDDWTIQNDWEDRSQSAIASMPRLADAVNAVLAVNGDFIAQRDTGIVVRSGVVRRAVDKTDVGCYYCDGTFRSIAKADFDLQKELSNYLYHSMTFGPVLVQNGTALSNIQTSVKAAAPRTGFGYYEPGHYVFTVVDGRQEGYSVGMDIDTFAAFMGSLGVREAYNLDGGASSVMYFNGKVINKQSGSRGVSDIFYLGEVQE